MGNIALDKINTPIVFHSQPETIPGDLRPLWRISILILILHLTSRGARASLSKIHVLNWAVRSDENRDKLLTTIQGKLAPDIIFIRVDPALNRAIDLACGENLVKHIAGDRVQLTARGIKIANQLLEQDDLFLKEVDFLKEIGKTSLTESLVSRLFKEG